MKRVRCTKGIAAFEFILVYGLVMVAVGAIFVAVSTYDLHRPQSYATASCNSHSFGCVQVVPSDGASNPDNAGVLFVLSNALSDTLLLQQTNNQFADILGATCTAPATFLYVRPSNSDSCGWTSVTDEDITNVRILPGQEFAVRVRCAEFTTARSAFVSGEIQLEYVPQGKSFRRIAHLEFRNYEVLEGVYDVGGSSCPST